MGNSTLAWWILPAVVIHSWKDPEVTIHTNASVLERKWIIYFFLPFLETNWEVTPTSNVANTGEWSLVTISSVQPKKRVKNIH